VKKISRRDFLKVSAAGLGAVLSQPKFTSVNGFLPDIKPSYRLGRVLPWYGTVDVKSKPDPDSTTIETRYEDDILICDREINGKSYPIYPKSTLWYETPNGYVPSFKLQPVMMEPNVPIVELPIYGEKPGMWAEITVPYVDIYQDNLPAKSPLLKITTKPRFYYSQILWIDGIKEGQNGNRLYHVTEKYGSYGDTFWAEAEAFKPLTPEDLSPIRPEILEKKIVVDVHHQTMSCYERNQEILFARVATGALWLNDGSQTEAYSTPVGDYHSISRKYISLHMAGGSKASGWETLAVSWSSIFANGGVAVHSTFWHNNYGYPMSHGCVNVQPDVAKFVFRWSQPVCQYDPGVIEITDYSGTNVQVTAY